jgi:hypothetical protein
MVSPDFGMRERRELSRDFIVKNPHGEQFLRLSVRNDGPRLILKGPGGIQYSKSKGAPAWEVRDETGALRLKGWWAPDELTISLYNEEGEMCRVLKVDRVFMNLRAWGLPRWTSRDLEHPKGMEVYDEAGRRVWRVTVGSGPPPWEIEAEPA